MVDIIKIQIARIQIHKYSKENLLKYALFTQWFSSTPDWHRIKFLDEVHFSGRDCNKAKMIGPLGKRPIRLNFAPIDYRLSCTVLATPQNINGPPLFLSMREGSNTQFDFCKFIYSALEQHAIVPDDILVMDNAAVHSGSSSFEILRQTCEYMGVSIYFLPAYSPEFNPCELVFGSVKADLRAHYTGGYLPAAVLAAFACITHEQLWSFYAHCVPAWPPFVSKRACILLPVFSIYYCLNFVELSRHSIRWNKKNFVWREKRQNRKSVRTWSRRAITDRQRRTRREELQEERRDKRRRRDRNEKRRLQEKESLVVDERSAAWRSGDHRPIVIHRFPAVIERKVVMSTEKGAFYFLFKTLPNFFVIVPSFSLLCFDSIFRQCQDRKFPVESLQQCWGHIEEWVELEIRPVSSYDKLLCSNGRIVFGWYLV